MTEVPKEVLEVFGFAGAGVAPVSGGLINNTFRVDCGADSFIVQRLHKIFSAEVNEDIEAVTAHLALKKLSTPRLVRTKSGGLWHTVGSDVWRAMTLLPGHTFHQVQSDEQAFAAGHISGRFHVAASDLDHTFAFTRTGVHDTDAHLAKLRACIQAAGDNAMEKDGIALGQKILDAASRIPPLPKTRKRLCHGDLKLSNILFSEDGGTALSVVDLDTMGYQQLAFEMGDALRSWCNPRGEDIARPDFNLDYLRAAMSGYRDATGDAVSDVERRSIAAGLHLVCVELAARFAADVFEDSYFGWDSQRFSSRSEHNLLRAKGQLALGLAVEERTEAVLSALG